MLPLCAAPQFLDHIEQMPGSDVRREELLSRHASLERLAEIRRDGAGMQRDAGSQRVRPRQFDAERLDDHVERRLRGAIAVPAAQPVVADAADPRGERSEHGRPVPGEKRQEVPGDERRAGRIDGEVALERGARKLAIALLRHDAVGVEEPGRDDHEVERSLGAQS